jgi:hypothetical protein
MTSVEDILIERSGEDNREAKRFSPPIFTISLRTSAESEAYRRRLVEPT